MKKLFAVLLAICLMISVCGAMADTLTMGTNAAFAPYEYYEDGVIVGIDAEIAAAIAEKLGMELEIVDMDFDAIIPSVVSGKVLMGMAGMTVTPERLQNVNFSNTYAIGIQSIIVKEGSPITSVDDLSNSDYIIGVQKGTTGHIYCEGDYGTDRIRPYANGSVAVEALKDGKVDCVVIDNEPAKRLVEVNEGLVILETAYAEEEYAIAMALENTELLEKINAALDELLDDGTLQAIVSKYIPVE